jgi:hypothetical protein
VSLYCDASCAENRDGLESFAVLVMIIWRFALRYGPLMEMKPGGFTVGRNGTNVRRVSPAKASTAG